MHEEPPAVTSTQINKLLGKALVSPEVVSPREIFQIAEAVVFHVLLAEKTAFAGACREATPNSSDPRA